MDHSELSDDSHLSISIAATPGDAAAKPSAVVLRHQPSDDIVMPR
jgi:hypothetical protein